MGRVVLLNPPGSQIQIRDLYCSVTSKGHYYWEPIDLVVLSGLLRDRHDLLVVDAVGEGHAPVRTLELIAGFRPDAVISLTGSASWEDDFRLFRQIKEETGARLIVTGDLSLDKSFEMLKGHDCIDASLLDFTGRGVLEYLDGGGDGRRINNIVYRRNGEIVQGEQVSDFGKTFTIPVPRHDLFPLHRYRLPYVWRYPMATVLASFACPFPCTFCIQSSHVMRYKYRPAENVLEELLSLKSLGVREILFRDPMFEANRKNTQRLCELMVEHQLDLTWSCNSRVDTLDEALVILMKQAGCHYVIFGLESGDEGILARCSKKITLRQSEQTIALCRKHGIRTAGYFIIGLPGETVETARNTIRFARTIGIDYASFAVPSPDYGTPLRKEAIAKGWITGDFDTFNRSKMVVIKHENLTQGEIEALLKRAYREFYFRPGYVWDRLREIKSPRQFMNAVRESTRMVRNYLEA